VKGFAFTLGLSTILDLVVVFLFTHPIVSLLSRSATFGSARFTGLNAVRAGGIVPDQPLEAPAAGGRVRVPKRAAASARTSAPVAVLDDEQPQDDLAEPPVAEPSVAEAPAVEPAEPPAEPRAERREPERGPSAPQPGTAAERAAARRARMRAQNEKGKR
jgi:preprotein translocase subunit SecD